MPTGGGPGHLAIVSPSPNVPPTHIFPSTRPLKIFRCIPFAPPSVTALPSGSLATIPVHILTPPSERLCPLHCSEIPLWQTIWPASCTFITLEVGYTR